MKLTINILIGFLCLLIFSTGELQAQTQKYPYVTGGNTIVSRDELGGVKSEALLTDTQKEWLRTTNSATNTYKEVDEYNQVSAKFEVAKSNAGNYAWSNAFTACRSYSQSGSSQGEWRLPTQREVILIWVLKPKLTASDATFSNYWSSSMCTSYPGHIWNLEGNIGYIGHRPNEDTIIVRCVRDL